MSVLTDVHDKLTHLLATIGATEKSYRIAQQALAQFDSGEVVNLEGLGMNLQFGDTVIPVPLPTDQAVLSDRIAEATAFLGEDLVRLWNEVYNTAALAKQHCDEAQARAAAAVADAPPHPAASTSVIPPAAPQAPAHPQQPPSQPRVNQVHTVPVGDGS